MVSQIAMVARLACVQKVLLDRTVMKQDNAPVNKESVENTVKLVLQDFGDTTNMDAHVRRWRILTQLIFLLVNLLACKCNEKFSRATQCNLHTGQCQCLPGVVGEKCEHCPDRWVLIPETGCQECGNCVHVLLNDTDELYELIEPIQKDIQDTSSSALAFRKLNFYKSKNENFTTRLDETFKKTTERQKKLFSDFQQMKKETIFDIAQKLDLKVSRVAE